MMIMQHLKSPFLILKGSLAGAVTTLVLMIFGSLIVSEQANSAPAIGLFSCDFGICEIDTGSADHAITSTYDINANTWGIAVSPDGIHGYASTGNDPSRPYNNSLVVMNLVTKTIEGNIPTGGVDPRGIAVTPDGSHVLVTHYQSDLLSIIDTSTNTVVAYVSMGSGQGLMVAVSPDGSKAFVPQNRLSKMIDLNPGSSFAALTVPSDDYYSAAAWSPDGTNLFVVGWAGVGYEYNLTVIDTTTPSYPVIKTIALPAVAGGYMGIALSPDGNRLYISNADNLDAKVYVFDAGNSDIPLVTTISIPYIGYQLAVTPDGTRLIVPSWSWDQGGMIYLVDTASNLVLESFPLPRALGIGGVLPPPQGIPFSGNNTSISTSGIGVAQVQGAASMIAPRMQSSLGASRQPVKKITLKSTFTLDPQRSNGISPQSESFRLLIGRFNVTIPKGCFRYLRASKSYLCNKKLDDISYNVRVKATKTRGTYLLTLTAKGMSLPSEFTHPLPISFSLGNDAGQNTIP